MVATSIYYRKFKGIEIKTIVNDNLLAGELINKFSMDSLIASGLFDEYKKLVYKNDYLLIPYFHKDNKIITIKARDTKEKIYKNLKGRPLYLYGINHLYNGITLSTDREPKNIEAKEIKNVYIVRARLTL